MSNYYLKILIKKNKNNISSSLFHGGFLVINVIFTDHTNTITRKIVNLATGICRYNQLNAALL